MKFSYTHLKLALVTGSPCFILTTAKGAALQLLQEQRDSELQLATQLIGHNKTSCSCF